MKSRFTYCPACGKKGVHELLPTRWDPNIHGWQCRYCWKSWFDRRPSEPLPEDLRALRRRGREAA
jgi:hypothetical protein